MAMERSEASELPKDGALALHPRIRPFIGMVYRPASISIQQSKPRSVREAVTVGFVLALLDSAWPLSGHDLLSNPTGLYPRGSNNVDWASSFFYLTHDIRAIDVSALLRYVRCPN